MAGDERTELMAPGAVSSPEGPRWHDGALWFSDQWGANVWRFHDGELEPAADVARPSGLGFLPNGDLVVASMGDPVVTRQGTDGQETLADLSPMGVHLNDLTIDDQGRCYVNAYGRDAQTNGALVLFGYTLVLFYHMGNGIRHLAWDFGYGFEVEAARRSGVAVLAFAGAMTLLVWLIGALAN